MTKNKNVVVKYVTDKCYPGKYLGSKHGTDYYKLERIVETEDEYYSDLAREIGANVATSLVGVMIALLAIAGIAVMF